MSFATSRLGLLERMDEREARPVAQCGLHLAPRGSARVISGRASLRPSRSSAHRAGVKRDAVRERALQKLLLRWKLEPPRPPLENARDHFDIDLFFGHVDCNCDGFVSIGLIAYPLRL